jgi:hypothetical protein
MVLSVAVLMVVGFMTATDAFAQRNRSVCERNGYYDTRVNIDGVWNLTFYGGSVKHEMVMAIRRQSGYSITSFYSSSLRRVQEVEQTHVVCESNNELVILGFNPKDRRTGRAAYYNADNFFFSVRRNGNVTAYNIDDSGTRSNVQIQYVRGL